MHSDVIVLGLGAMGSAACFHIAQRGGSVLGLDQYRPPHDHGSTHGATRMIRQAYGEGADYVPLVLRAYELWEKLERDAGVRLLFTTGGLVLGSPDGHLVQSALVAARRHAIPCEILDAAATRKKFSPIALLPGEVAVHDLRAGYLLAEECVRAHLLLAAGRGADLRLNEQVLSWKAEADVVRVTTQRTVYTAEHLVITAGPWASALFRNLLPLKVTRQVMAWIEPRGELDAFLPDRFPVFLSECEDGRPAYGFPAVDGPGGGVKAAIHGSVHECTPESVDRTISSEDTAELSEKVGRRIPALRGRVVKAQTCLYTMTPDEHFIIGKHPEHRSVSLACGFSGHGFKFSSVVGEILADLALTSETSKPIAMFSPLRFMEWRPGDISPALP
jgi:sarcosine oxidase